MLKRLTNGRPFALSAAAGLLLGLGLFTFNYAEGTSYLSSDPVACANCHVMTGELDAWQKGPHHAAAKCVDCHLPHDLAGKLIAKAENGYHHSKGFTLQDFHEPIIIKTKSAGIVQDNCVRCHGDFVHAIVAVGKREADAAQCAHCHRRVGHSV